MRKSILLLISILFLTSISHSAIEINLLAGQRMYAGDAIKNTYGSSSMIYCPGVAIRVGNFMIGAAYEGSTAMTGETGLYDYKAEFSLSGFYGYIGYRLAGKLAPYVKAGVGMFNYKQSIDTSNIHTYPVELSENATAFFGAGGLSFAISKEFAIMAEIAYLLLKVKPYDTEVDLGGLRIAGGIGLRF